METKFIDLALAAGQYHNETELNRAYRSLAKHPKQLFDIFLKRETQEKFFATFDQCGTKLATHLGSTPEYFGHPPSSNHTIQLRSDEWHQFQETVGAFLFSLFPLTTSDEDDISQEALGAMIMAAIKTIRPEGGRLELLGAGLVRVPHVLTMLIADGRLGKWALRNPQSFSNLALHCWDDWVPTVTTLAERCLRHSRVFSGVGSFPMLEYYVKSFPCAECPWQSSTGAVNKIPRGTASREMRDDVRAFENLLGEHLGPWKLVISGEGLKSLRAVSSGSMLLLITSHLIPRISEINR